MLVVRRSSFAVWTGQPATAFCQLPLRKGSKITRPSLCLILPSGGRHFCPQAPHAPTEPPFPAHMLDFRSSLPLPSSHARCELWAAYDAAFTIRFRCSKPIGTMTAWPSLSHAIWRACGYQSCFGQPSAAGKIGSFPPTALGKRRFFHWVGAVGPQTIHHARTFQRTLEWG